MSAKGSLPRHNVFSAGRTHQTRFHRGRRLRVYAQKSNSIVILPGLGNNKKDYEPLAALLRKRDLVVEIADVSRPDWYSI